MQDMTKVATAVAISAALIIPTLTALATPDQREDAQPVADVAESVIDR